MMKSKKEIGLWEGRCQGRPLNLPIHQHGFKLFIFYRATVGRKLAMVDFRSHNERDAAAQAGHAGSASTESRYRFRRRLREDDQPGGTSPAQEMERCSAEFQSSVP